MTDDRAAANPSADDLGVGLDDVVKASTAAWFSSRRIPVHAKWPHVLRSKDEWHRNIIDPDVAAHLASTPLHKSVHYGTSSQALLFNLVGAMLLPGVDGGLEPLRQALRKHTIPWPVGSVNALLEYQDRRVMNETCLSPTSVDLAIRSRETPEAGLYIECKFTETGFGGCSNARDECGLAHPMDGGVTCYYTEQGIGYWDALERLGFYDTLPRGGGCPLRRDYQFYRMVLFAVLQRGRFVLLYDERNRRIAAHLDRLRETVPPACQEAIGALTVQDVLEECGKWQAHTSWLPFFREKYGLL